MADYVGEFGIFSVVRDSRCREGQFRLVSLESLRSVGDLHMTVRDATGKVVWPDERKEPAASPTQTEEPIYG
jgi:hypothetical protein